MRLLYAALLRFGILEDTAFEVTKGIVEADKVKKEEEKERKEYP